MNCRYTLGPTPDDKPLEKLTRAEALDRYGHLLTTEEQANIHTFFEELICYDEYLQTLEDEDTLKKEFLACWIEYLKHNRAYKAYCSARWYGHRFIKKFETKYPGISDFYEDIGDIHNGDAPVDHYQLFNERKHLFFRSNQREVLEGSLCANEPDRVLVSIPKGIKTSNELKSLLDVYWNKTYEPVHSAEPKYKFRCEITIHNLLKHQKTLLVNEFLPRSTHTDCDYQLSLAEIGRRFMFSPGLRFRFRLDESWQRDAELCEHLINLPKDSDLRPLRMGNLEIQTKKQHMIDLKRGFDLCVKKILTGQFPE